MCAWRLHRYETWTNILNSTYLSIYIYIYIYIYIIYIYYIYIIHIYIILYIYIYRLWEYNESAQCFKWTEYIYSIYSIYCNIYVIYSIYIYIYIYINCKFSKFVKSFKAFGNYEIHNIKKVSENHEMSKASHKKVDDMFIIKRKCEKTLTEVD